MSNPRDRVVGAVVLAAGESKRLGQPKQLASYNGRPLLAKAIGEAVNSGANPIVVVLGAFADEIEDSLPPAPDHVRFVRNENWREGMGTSIACGVRRLLDANCAITGLLILVCDQPATNAELLGEFVGCHSSQPDRILLSDYGTGRGPPVLFPRAYFDELLALKGDTGAREVHRRHAEMIRIIPFPGGSKDIDTPTDLHGLRT